MEHSDALDLEQGAFLKRTPRDIAQSLKHSAEQSKRRKGTPFQSAMSMLNFFINRGGKNLSAAQKWKLEKTKDALRILFGREEKSPAAKAASGTGKKSNRKKSNRKTAARKTTKRKQPGRKTPARKKTRKKRAS